MLQNYHCIRGGGATSEHLRVLQAQMLDNQEESAAALSKNRSGSKPSGTVKLSERYAYNCTSQDELLAT